MAVREIDTAVPGSASRLTRGSLGLLSVVAGGVGVYLLSLSLAGRHLPAGCGAGSGCAEVLSSRWSQVFVFPVSGAAVAVYSAVLMAVFLIGPQCSLPQQRLGWSLLVGLAVAIAGSAAWFITLQIAVVRAMCPWCMAEHVLGLVTAAIVFLKAPIARHAGARKSPSPPSQLSARRALGSGLVGAALVAILAVSQGLFSSSSSQLGRLPEGQNVDTGPGAQRGIAVLNGKLALAPHQLPVLGSPDAPKLLVLLFDYCCPHCRATHGYLLHGMATRPNQFSVILLPAPLNTKCNPFWKHTEARFEHACELAQFALAVWKADRAAFARFDAWLFEPQTPRDPVAARRYAEQLVTPAALQAALADAAISAQIKQDVTAFHQSGAERIPVILSPGMQGVVGRPDSEEELFRLLQKELDLRPVP